VLAGTLDKKKITVDEVNEISQIFYDGKTSARILQEQSKFYIS
jgi:hypothetical protein